MEELRILYIVLSTTDDVHLLIEEAKCKLFFGRRQKTFWMQNSKICYRTKILP